MSLYDPVGGKYSKKVAYFSMEFAIHQALKIYSGGLGFLSGSHMRSVYELKQNVVGVGILWTYGYYDQSRNEDGTMRVSYRRKNYSFLKDLDVTVSVKINGHDVFVKVFYLDPEIFGTAPMYLLTTDIPENEYLSRTITHKLYEAEEQTRIAQEIVLGIGGAKILDKLGIDTDIYHMNEGHSIPLAFYLYEKFGFNRNDVRDSLVFTTHTPEAAGNEEHDYSTLSNMGFFNGLQPKHVEDLTGIREGERFSLTVAALRASKIANAVSEIHGNVSRKMWQHLDDIAPIIHITNAQNRRYWADKPLVNALDEHDDYALLARKRHLKRKLFDIVADQTGKLFDPEVLTIVWARRFAEYKRANLIKRDFQKFLELVNREEKPIQIIWAGKPHPADNNGVNLFNEIVHVSRGLKRCAILVGYELGLSGDLKKGADIWLNNPRVTREASGTSGMSAAMNGAINVSINDGWHVEFEQNGKNCFTFYQDSKKDIMVQDEEDNRNLVNMLEDKIIPLYYDQPKKWLEIMKNSMNDVIPQFDSGRMANEYYEKLYNYER